METTQLLMPEVLTSATLPQRTSTYFPVHHVELMERVTDIITKQNGLEIQNIDYKFNATGTKMISMINTTSEIVPGTGLQLGVMNSYDKSMKLKLGFGGKVLICSNGMFTADMFVSQRKHSKSLENDLEYIFFKLNNSIDKRIQTLKQDQEALQSVDITKDLMYQLLMEMYYEDKIITSTQFNIIKNELYYSENFKMLDNNHELLDASLWNFYNNITESLKTSRPEKFFENHQKAHEKLIEITL